MEIRCPHCQNPLTIDDHYAGQLMRCPTCNGTFQAPSLPPATNDTWVPPAPVEPLPPQTAPPTTPPTTPPAEPTTTKKKERPPISEGDYSRSYTISLTGQFLPWIAPVGLSLIFLLSFFPWLTSPSLAPGVIARPSMWALAFGSNPEGTITMFVMLSIFLAWPLSIVSVLISLKIIPLQPPLDVIASFRSIIVGALALGGFIFFALAYLQHLFAEVNYSALAMKLAFRVAFVVALAALLQFWLDRRQIRKLPPPQITVRW